MDKVEVPGGDNDTAVEEKMGLGYQQVECKECGLDSRPSERNAAKLSVEILKCFAFE